MVYDRIMARPPRGATDRERGDDGVRRYSTDVRHAEQVLLRIVTDGPWAYVPPDSACAAPAVVLRAPDGRAVRGEGATRALAICRAALLTTVENSGT